MRVVVVGAGPTGLLVGAGLAGRDHQVTVVDRDAGPPRRGRWQRRGVMQFEHAHGFRFQVPDVLERHWPEAYRAWLDLGARPRDVDPTGAGRPAIASRRVTFERALHRAAASTPGLHLRQAVVDGLVEDRGRVVGCRIDGQVVDADLVVDASGRSGRLTVEARGGSDAVLGGDCGIAYVNRTYRLHDEADPGPSNFPLGWFGSFAGYLVLLFTHERGHFSVVFVRPTANRALKELRHDVAFDAACRAIPGLSDWTDPRRAAPTSPALAGGALRNTYRPQRRIPGLVAIGDSVATTAPTAGRGVALAYLQVDEFLRLLDAGVEPTGVGEPFDAWCEREILPWVLDHLRTDEEAARRWQGHDVDLDRPLPSDLIVAAAQVEPALRERVGPYLAMTAPPASLAAAEPVARALFRTGWRPPLSPGPTADDLVDLITAALPAAG